MAEQNATPVEIKGVITTLNANFNYIQQPERWEFPQQGQQPTPRTSIRRPKMELDTENIRLSFMITNPAMGDLENNPSSYGSITMKKDDIKRLNLTVGDTVMLKVSKE